jgi:hypothetical protein
MKSKSVLQITLALGVAITIGTAAYALVIAKGDPAQKLRKDVDKQTAKFAICVGKAAVKCEAAGMDETVECNISNPAMSTVPQAAIDELVADEAKCVGKLNLSKKGTDYVGIGCPGDSDGVTGGDQPFADFNAYAASVPATTKGQIDLLGGILGPGCCNMMGTDCVVTQGDLGVAYAKATFKCISKCENDYKNKKGDGGNTDALVNCDPGAPSAGGFTDCMVKAVGKAPGLCALLKNALDGAINDARDDLYNENDCP